MMRDEYDENLVRLYCRGVLSCNAIDRRRSGEKGLGDKYFFAPKVREMEKCLNSNGVEGFFSSDNAFEEGISMEGFVEFLDRIDSAEREYKRREDDFGIGWRN